MFDLHTHSLLSDGELLPSELVRRYIDKGYKAIAITDHVDSSNIKNVVGQILEFSKKFSHKKIKLIPGIELTHIPLEQFEGLIKFARLQGIKLIVAHGETIVEPVSPGTNKKALTSDIDILAHPGLITEEAARLANKKGILLEVTSRNGHCLTNGHVVKVARKFNASLAFNSDSHKPSDILSIEQMSFVAYGAGISKQEFRVYQKKLQKYIDKIIA